MDTLTQARQGRAPRRVAPAVLALLESARHGLLGASEEINPGARYVAAHLAALRAAAAVVAARPATETGSRRKALKSVWELLPRVEPALAEWAAFFAAGARKRAAAEAGLPKAVTAPERGLMRCGRAGVLVGLRRGGRRCSPPLGGFAVARGAGPGGRAPRNPRDWWWR